MDEINYSELKTALSILGLKEGASINEIRAAFRILSVKYHPDQCKEPDAAICRERFEEIKRAYDTLLSYAANYPITFSKGKKKTDDYDHIDRFYDGWLGDIK